MSFTAKSVIFYLTNTWGNTSTIGIREIDFYFEGTKLELVPDDYSTYASAGGTYAPKTFDTSLSLTGSDSAGWYASGVYNRVLIVNFDTEQEFDSIKVNNYHNSGSYTNRGVKEAQIYISPNSVSYASYGQVLADSTLIFDDQFSQHVSSNVEDTEELSLITPGGTSLTDMVLDILAVSNVTEDFGIDISAYYKSMSDVQIDVFAIGEISLDKKLDIFAANQDFDFVPLDIGAAKEQIKNTILDIYLANGIINQDVSMDIFLGDGNNITDMGLDVLAVSTMPEFKSVYAMNLNSAIKEVVS